MKKTILLTLVLAFGLVTKQAKAYFICTQKANMPTPRWAHSSAEVNGKIYVIGGWSSEPNNSVLSTVEMYDPSTDTWTRKADIPTARCYFSTCVVNGKIYAIGGWVGRSVSSMEMYDPTSDTWTKKADMPTARCDLSTCVVDGRIYAIGGDPGTYNGLTVVEVYNPELDAWTRKADMPTGRWGLYSSVVDGKIYSMGGAPNIVAVNTVEEYEPATDTWTTKANMPTARRNMGSVVLCGKIYAIGGWRSSGNTPYSVVEEYDPATDTWTIHGDIPSPRAVLSTSVVNVKIYVIGGTYKSHPCPATSTVYELGALSPDFNGDGIVDAEDMCIMVDHWGEDYYLCDIGPLPFGDGIVNAQDLIVLSEYFSEDVNDPSLMAHWSLDETEGIFAADSAGDNDAFIVGGALWQPGSGQVDGALQFNGLDCCAIAGLVLNPADGPFSIFTWIKDGAPGQVIVSQQAMANWLATDTEGNLMTELKSSDQLAGPLNSETVITDGQWHRIGLVWDGSHRTLYVDAVAVADDTQPGLVSSQMGLYIGVDKNYAPGTFFSGLIDDVRIYDRVVSP